MGARATSEYEASLGSKLLALSVAFCLLGASVLSMRFLAVQGPHVPAFISIVGTLWCAADLLTAFLLYAQFRVTGTVGYLVIACAYCVTGALTIPYLAAFPGIFLSGKQFQQVSVSVWLTWHTIFPLVLGACCWFDPNLAHRWIDERAARRRGNRVLAATGFGALAVGFALWILHAQLPVFVVNGHFLPVYAHVAAPLAAALNFGACTLILTRVRRPSALHVWLAVALFSTGLDCALNAFSITRYGFPWYVGKFETLVTACVLLGVLLSEVEFLYRRIESFALLDPLTGLRNRRSFDDAAHFVLGVSRRKGLPVAVLMMDLDHFKFFNDTFGHAVGDELLKKLGVVLRRELSRGTDLVARYGGEEFVAMLVDVDMPSLEAIADRILRAVRAVRVSDPEGKGVAVTISIGAAWASRASALDDYSGLVRLADGALYEAKALGRDRWVSAPVTAGGEDVTLKAAALRVPDRESVRS